MAGLNLDQFETQKLLIDAHKMYPTVLNVTKGIFGFITTITIRIPKDTYDWLATEIGDKVGPGVTDFINGDHTFRGSKKEHDFGGQHSTLLGLWRDM